jgi:hypothetical protein
MAAACCSFGAKERNPTARDATLRNYQKLLERMLEREFTGWKVDRMRSAMDREHSFGPAYVRGHLLKGTTAEAVIGGSAAEPGAIVDGVLTVRILWLQHCRDRTATSQGRGPGLARRHFGGLRVVVPLGAWWTTGRAHGVANPCRRGFSALRAGRTQRGTSPKWSSATGATWSHSLFMGFRGRQRLTAAAPALSG